MQSYIPQIPWQKFSEESIQSMLELFFKFNGYKTYNQHQIQRSIENGADIILKKRNKKIYNELDKLVQERIKIKNSKKSDLDDKINSLVYKLYGIEEEKKIIEDSLK